MPCVQLGTLFHTETFSKVNTKEIVYIFYNLVDHVSRTGVLKGP